MKSQLNWEEKSGHWLLTKVLRHLIRDFRGQVMMGRYIKKQPLYLRMQWRFHFSREDSQEVLRDLAKAFPGILFTNQGLRISSAYLDRDTWVVCENASHEPFRRSDVLEPAEKQKPGTGGKPSKGGESDEAVE
jgi:hypothetical protein